MKKITYHQTSGFILVKFNSSSIRWSMTTYDQSHTISILVEIFLWNYLEFLSLVDVFGYNESIKSHLRGYWFNNVKVEAYSKTTTKYNPEEKRIFKNESNSMNRIKLYATSLRILYIVYSITTVTSSNCERHSVSL